jgi:hypothetical protein
VGKLGNGARRRKEKEDVTCVLIVKIDENVSESQGNRGK